MLNLLYLFLLLLPLVPLVCLFVIRTDVWRRNNLMLLAFMLCIELMWYVLMSWVDSVVGAQVFAQVFDGVGGAFITGFYGGALIPIAYVLLIAAVGFFADRRASAKLSQNACKKVMDESVISAAGVKSLNVPTESYFEAGRAAESDRLRGERN
jgi:hypothetical protein